MDPVSLGAFGVGVSFGLSFGAPCGASLGAAAAVATATTTSGAATATAAATVVAASTTPLLLPATVCCGITFGLAALSWKLLEVFQSEQLPMNAETCPNNSVKEFRVRKLHLKSRKRSIGILPTLLTRPRSKQSHKSCVQEVEDLEQAGLSLRERLGQGAFGTVYRGVFQAIDVAVKSFAHNAWIPKEVEILSNVDQHPHILKVHACFLHDQQHFLVMELISGSELEAFLFDNVFEDYAAELRFFASQIVQAMEFLHSRMIGHFDLKGSNLMVDQCRCLKVIDFGLSEVVRGPLTSRRESTAHYLAPEIMFVNRHAEGSYGLAADVWSLGVNLYYFWMERLPFADDEGLPFDIYNVVLYDYHDLPDYHNFGHDALLAVIRSLLCRQPAHRPTFHDLAQDPFFCESE